MIFKSLILFMSVFLTLSVSSSCSNRKETMFKVPQLFSDGMVIQRDTTIAIWGTYFPNKKIDISCSWGFDTDTFSDSFGNWNAKIETNLNRDQQSILISSSKDHLKIDDILLGEVWVASGQSNMEMTFDYCCNSTDSSSYEIKTANFSNIRMYNVKKALSQKPLSDTNGEWISAVGKKITNFSAVGYFFAKKLHLELDVPIGIIHSSWGGSNIQSWASSNVLKQIEDFSEKLKDIQKDSLKYKKTKDWYSQFENIPSGSHWWDLFLSEAFPEINYLDFLLPGWKSLDHLGENDIKNFSHDSYHWKDLTEKNIIKPILNNSNFSGAVLFKNEFELDSLHSDSYDLIIRPDKDKPSGLWEYDLYINGAKVGSSLIDLKGADYVSNKQDQKYNIDSKLLKIGENTIIFRVLGIASLGEIKIRSSSPLAQAQQQQDVATIDRFLGMVQQRVGPQLLNVLVKQDEVAKYVAKKLGVPEELIRSQEEMQEAAQQMQQMMQQQQGQEQPPEEETQ